MGEESKQTALPVAKKKTGDIHYSRNLSSSVKNFFRLSQKTSTVVASKKSNDSNKRKESWDSSEEETQNQAFETFFRVDGTQEQSESVSVKRKYLTKKVFGTPTFPTTGSKYKLIHGMKAFVVPTPSTMTFNVAKLVYSEGGLWDLVQNRLEIITRECNNPMLTPEQPDREVDMLPRICKGKCTFVSKPIFLQKDDGSTKKASDLTYLILSPKSLKDSQWMVGFLKHLFLDDFLKNVSEAIKALNKHHDYDAVVLSQSILCVPYTEEKKEIVLKEHIDGVRNRKKETTLYSVSIPITLLQGSAPEFHLINKEITLKYKFVKDHALCFASNQGHSTASLPTSTFVAPNNVRVNLMMVVGDRNYLANRPEGFKEQVLEMSDPCYPGSTLTMEEMLQSEQNFVTGSEGAAWNARWNTYVSDWMKAYDSAHDHFKECMESNN